MDAFSAPISPLGHQGKGPYLPMRRSCTPGTPPGSTSPSSQPQIFEILSKILRIAHLSSTGGRFLSKKEEKKAIQRLVQLKEDLYDRKVHHSAMDEALLENSLSARGVQRQGPHHRLCHRARIPLSDPTPPQTIP